MGKHKPIWDPSTDCGDYVVATGCNDVLVTGKKKEQKMYYKRTTRPGVMKSLSMESMIRKWGGGEVLKRAVRGMLPKNRLRDKRLDRLKGMLLLFFSSCSFLWEFRVREGGARRDQGIVCFKVVTDGSIAVFEGEAHPYRTNLIKFEGRIRQVEPEVKTEALKQTSI